MKLDEVPVVLVVAGSKVKSIARVIANLYDYCGLTLFYIVCPTSSLEDASCNVADLVKLYDGINIKIVDENEVIPQLSVHLVNSLMEHLRFDDPKMPGWYYQQFLKMGFAEYFKDSDYYLIWDADTLLVKRIDFVDSQGRVLLTEGNEYHTSYFAFFSKLFPHIPITNSSYIAQHMLIFRPHMLSLISDIEEPGQPWYSTILAKLDSHTPFQLSEYEFYANYCLDKYPDKYLSIKRSWFRYGTSFFRCDLKLADVSGLQDAFDYVAFESWDKPSLLRTVAARLFVYSKRKFMKLRGGLNKI